MAPTLARLCPLSVTCVKRQSNTYVDIDSSIDICSFSASFFPRLAFGVDAVSDLRFVPAAAFGEALVWDEDGLELCPASLADDLVPAMVDVLDCEY